MPERVALCTLVDQQREWLTGHVARQWAGLDFGDAEVVVFACADCPNGDTPEETQATVEAMTQPLNDAVPWPVCAIHVGDLAERVDGLPSHDEVAGGVCYSHPAFLHKIAELREAVRAAAVAEHDGRQADYLFWLDSDTVPPVTAYRQLRTDLDATQGAMAPLVYAGIYPERRTGRSIPQWRSRGEPYQIPLPEARLLHADFSGFGCTLVPRQVAEQVTWQDFGRYRYQRREALERNPAEKYGMQGEDVWWFRHCELAYGPALCIDTRVNCRHYHRDGSYWVHEWRDESGPAATSRYITDEVNPAARWTVAGCGTQHGLLLPEYRGVYRPLGPHLLLDCSPEYAEALVRQYPQDVEIVWRGRGDEVERPFVPQEVAA